MCKTQRILHLKNYVICAQEVQYRIDMDKTIVSTTVTTMVAMTVACTEYKATVQLHCRAQLSKHRCAWSSSLLCWRLPNLGFRRCKQLLVLNT